jgi:hypothetical protein
MNDYAQARREKLGAVLGDESVPLSRRVEAAFELLEAEVHEAFQRGVRSGRMPRQQGGGSRTARLSREGQTALQAGALRRVGRA